MSFLALTSLDIICILICLVSGMIGYKRGAINTLISFGGFIASFAIAWIFSPVMGNWLIKSGILNSLFEAINMNIVAQSLVDLGAQQSSIANSAIGAAIINGGQVMVNQSVETLTDLIIHAIAQSISFGIIVVGVSILCWFLQIAFWGITKIPVIGLINRLLGLAVGLILGVCMIGVLLWLFTVVNFYSGGTTNLPTYENSSLIQVGTPWVLNFIGIK